jgi:hypothetical protein
MLFWENMPLVSLYSTGAKIFPVNASVATLLLGEKRSNISLQEFTAGDF